MPTIHTVKILRNGVPPHKRMTHFFWALVEIQRSRSYISSSPNSCSKISLNGKLRYFLLNQCWLLIWRLMFRANCTHLNSPILSRWRCNMKLRNSNSAVITIKKVEKTWKLRRQFAKLLKESFVCRKVKIASTYRLDYHRW